MTADEARVQREFDAWLARTKREQQERRAARAVRMLRVRVKDPLPMARVWMRGPKWKRAFDVRHGLLADVDPVVAARFGRPGVKFWWYDFELDVRELVLEEIRPGVVAEWTDPYERWGAADPVSRAPPAGRSA